MSDDNPQPTSDDYQQQIAELRNSLDSVSARVQSLESAIETDHATLVEDHRKIETMELTGKVSTRPVGL